MKKRARMKKDPGFPVAAALRLLRQRESLSQMEVARRGGPDYRTISHWETNRKLPSLPLLHRYLEALGLTFCDFQLALDQVAETPGKLEDRLTDIEQRVSALEEEPPEEPSERDAKT